MKMYKDVPARYDAWDIFSQYAQTPQDLARKAKVEVAARGPLVAFMFDPIAFARMLAMVVLPRPGGPLRRM